MVYERNHITIVAMETWVFIVCWCFLLMTSVAAVGKCLVLVEIIPVILQ